MEKKKKVQKTLTEKNYKRVLTADTSLKIGTYLIPSGAVSIYAGVNWNTWLEQANGYQIGCGFACFIISVLLLVFGVTKYDEIISKKLSKMYFFGIVLCILGGASIYMASLSSSFGYMLLCTGAGLIGGGLSSTTEKLYTSQRLAQYKKELEGLGILKEEQKANKIREQAEKDAEIIKKREEEKVDLL